MEFIKSIAELGREDLPIAGGKAANLGELLKAGMPVPNGFVIITEGYRQFVVENQLGERLRQIITTTRMDDPAWLETASSQIQGVFRSGKIPTALAREIRQAYTVLGSSSLPVAVRSSATAEDLPDLSFAGQMDTYLNVQGEEGLLDAVVGCWSSLWTARAIGYRARNDISNDDVSLAVIVQQMVESEASGVMFTANPLTGKRTETVIDATFGLGEALVSGQVEPDHYVVESTTGRILSKEIGAKSFSIQGKDGGGTISVSREGSRQPALPDEQIVALTRLGKQISAHFGAPQDVEWAWADGKLYVVQSRPITSLYPLPAEAAAEPLEVLLSFGVWQGMLDPYTPLGQDMITGVFADAGQMFGAKMTAETQRSLLKAGERLYVNLTGFLKTSQGRRITKIFISSIDPVSGDILEKLEQEIQSPEAGKLSLRDKSKLARGLLPFVINVLFNILWPRHGRLRLEQKIEKELSSAQSLYAAPSNLVELVDAIERPALSQSKELLPHLVPGIASGQIPLQVLLRQAADIPGGPGLVMELTRGLPYNVTTQMDLALWRTSNAIQSDVTAKEYFQRMDVDRLVSGYRNHGLPPAAQAAVSDFLASYGDRGVGEIDLGRPRWNDDPAHIFQTLKSYLQIDPENSPEVTFQRGAEKAQQAQEQLEQAFRRAGGGRSKARMVRMMALRIRELGGLRETPKFVVIHLFGYIRSAFLKAGQELVETGVLSSADDVFFLHLPELKALGRGEDRDWQSLVTERRATYHRELRRKRIPRILLSDGRAFYDSPTPESNDSENILSGSPVSAGVVEGIVHVVIDPHGVQLLPGEILVCPATDPAWTPLFLAAGGLVMEVGGMMTHGSVVAREYGIPAVVGVRQATERLKNGQRVRVDGAAGRITIL
jgi:phosphohistidine swiveling domain-containing protein